GATDQENFLGCSGSGPGSDRQWFAVYDPAPGTLNQSAYTGPRPLVYLEWNNVVGPGNGGAQWNKSTDGLNYVNATADVTPATSAIYSPFGPDGYPAIDQVTGKVFQAAGCTTDDGCTSATAQPPLATRPTCSRGSSPEGRGARTPSGTDPTSRSTRAATTTSPGTYSCRRSCSRPTPLVG